jgi:hypothetical protein
MIMRAEDVAHRLIRNATNPRHDLGVVLIVLVVYQDDALIGYVDGHITAIAADGCGSGYVPEKNDLSRGWTRMNADWKHKFYQRSSAYIRG